MIFSKHITDYLAGYLDGRLDNRIQRLVDWHLDGCSACRDDLDRVRTARAALQGLSLVEAPESIWTRIEAGLDEQTRPVTPVSWRYAWAATAAVVVLAGYWVYTSRTARPWSVSALGGAPVAGTERIAGTASVRTGSQIDTDAASRARIQVGDIGTVDLQPNTSVQLVARDPSGFRLSLLHGSIHASILAPPRLFVVETPAATAVDLGCEYQAHCDRQGNGLLTVSQGWVALEWKGPASLVPAGASCRMRSVLGPGTPWFTDAPAELVEALERFDFAAPRDPSDLRTVLARARPRDTLTLWHLLSRVDSADRRLVFDRMAGFGPLPAGLSSEKVLSLDPESLKLWRDELAWTW